MPKILLHKTYHLLKLKGDIKFTVNRLIETFVPEEKQRDTEYIDFLKKDIFQEEQTVLEDGPYAI